MKFVISTKQLNSLLSKCLNIIPAKSTMPILANVLVEAANDELIITATDMTIGIRCFTEAKIIEEGSTTLPAKHFAQLIRELTTPMVEIETSANHNTTIATDSSTFKIHGMSGEEYPSLPDINEATQVKVKQAELKEMLFSTSFSVSREDNRHVLTGVYLDIGNDKAQFVGTDGKRLSRAYQPISVEPGFTGQYVVPLKAVEEIERNLLTGEEVTLYLMEDKIGINTGDTLIIAKLIVGEYPDVTKVVPQKPEKVVSLHREELLTLLRQVSLFVTDTQSDSVCFTFQDGELKLNINSSDKGEGEVSMPVNYEGEKLEIAFNPGYFIDVLRHTGEETVNLGITDSFNPGVLAEQEFDSEVMEMSPLYVLMPMRLSSNG